jgi:very-short-patch-repair endonuclease
MARAPSTDLPIKPVKAPNDATVEPMRAEIDALLEGSGSVASRRRLTSVVSNAALDDEIRRGHLVRVFARSYARPWDVDTPEVIQRAALISCGPGSALSHSTALRRHGLNRSGNPEPVHVTTPASKHPRGRPGRLVVHRSNRPLPRIRVSGLPTVDIPTALVQTWPTVSGSDGRAPLITATRNRRVRVDQVRLALKFAPKLARRRSLYELLDLIEAGCESELELWGFREVFTGPEFAAGRWQYPIRTANGSYRIDLAFEVEKLAVELDGRGYHSSDDQWQRDIRRDLALATIGWQTVRLSHQRLTHDRHGCRLAVAKVLQARRVRDSTAPDQRTAAR